MVARVSASELGVVIPVSIFERDGPLYFNSVVVLDADGANLGVYRKSHIPDGPGYMEKYYFRPGDTGFKAWKTKRGTIGVGICWDQWYPEAARAMVLQGAELLLYPTAIGSEPYDLSLDTHQRWQRVMQGHAGANMVPHEKNCRVEDYRDNGSKASYRLVCTGKDAMSGEGEMERLADGYRGSVHVVMGGEAQGQEMTLRYEGKRIGSCDVVGCSRT